MWYRTFICILFIVAAFRCFSRLEVPSLVKWDEQTNARVVFELISSTTFPTLTLKGAPFFEKPPLWYYTASGVVSLLGPTSVSLRLPSALSGFFLIILVWWAGTKWYGKLGGLVAAVLLLATNHVFVQNAGRYFTTHTFRTADPDSLQILFMFLSLLLFSPRLHRPMIGFAMAGLAFLTKGPLGLIPVAIYIMYIALSGDQKRDLVSQFATGFGVLVAILLPWYGFMIATYGRSFLLTHIGYHIAQRLVQPLEGHWEPPWFYLQILANKQVFPAFEYLLGAIIILPFLGRNQPWKYELFAPYATVVLIFLVIAIAQTKLAWYILPIYPFAALLVGGCVQEVFDRLRTKHMRPNSKIT